MISRDPIFQKVAAGVALGLLALACFNILRPFFGPLLWAVILTVATWPVFVWILGKIGGRRVWASVLTSILVAVFCLLPVTYGVAVTAQSIRPISQKLMEYSKEEVPPAPAWLKDYPFGKIVFQQWSNLSKDREKFFRDIDPLIRQVATRLGGAAGRIGVGLLEFSFALIICGFLFHGGENLTRVAETSLRRLFGPEGGELLDLAARTIRSVMLGVLGTAALQAGLMGAGFYLAGVPQVILLGFAGFFFA
ncbi:AI-2E family transporter, partial [bacterium]|nr:AI-2E family transporter [bacterium]